MPVIPAFWRLRQQDHHEAKLDYIVSSCLKKSQEKTKKKERNGFVDLKSCFDIYHCLNFFSLERIALNCYYVFWRRQLFSVTLAFGVARYIKPLSRLSFVVFPLCLQTIQLVDPTYSMLYVILKLSTIIKGGIIERWLICYFLWSLLDHLDSTSTRVFSFLQLDKRHLKFALDVQSNLWSCKTRRRGEKERSTLMSNLG